MDAAPGGESGPSGGKRSVGKSVERRFRRIRARAAVESGRRGGFARLLTGDGSEKAAPETRLASASRLFVAEPSGPLRVPRSVATFLVWLLLLFVCWPLAILALVLYPFVWLLLLPFRLVGITLEGVFRLLTAIIMLPARVLRGPRRAGIA